MTISVVLAEDNYLMREGVTALLAEHDGVPVLVRDGTCTVASFHPELTDDARLHELFVNNLE